MKILEKRPLALILCIMLGGFSFFSDFSVIAKLAIAFSSLLLIAIIFIFDTLKSSRKPLVVISLIAFSLSIFLSLLWQSAFYPSEYYGDTVMVEGKILDINNSGTATSVMVCESDKINGKRDRHTFITYVDKELARKINEYDLVSFTAQINELSSQDDGFDGRSYYVSKGYSAILDEITDLEVLGNDVSLVSELLSRLRLKISNTLKLRTDFETGAFLSALIVGDRSDLSGNTRLNFARLGISHILALSGMHLAILTVALNFLFIKCGIKKKLRVSILAVLVLFYMGLTGFSASVLRSGIMLIISGALYLLATKADAVTSLFISVAVIVLLNPVSIYDTSLWLSAFATLGVVVFAEMAEKADKLATKATKMLLALKNACLVSVFAFCATFAFVALRFNTFSVVSIFTTLIFSFVIQFFIYGGILLLLIGGVIPFGKLIVFFSDVILQFAELISSIKLVCVSMNSIAVKLLIVLVSVFFFAFLLLEIKNKRKGVAIILILLICVFAVAEVRTVAIRYDDEVVYAPSKSGDVVLLKSDGDITAIYSGKAFEDGAWDILEYFNDESITYIDNLIFASYSYYSIDFVAAISDGIKVERVMFPKPTTDDEIGICEGLSYLLEVYGARLEFYGILDYVELGENRYRLFEKVDYYYGEYPANVYEIVTKDGEFTYVSVCEYENLAASARALIWNSENLLIGTVGNSNYYLFDMRLDKMQKIYYSDDGRLTDSAEEYYNEKGVSIHCIKSPITLTD